MTSIKVQKDPPHLPVSEMSGQDQSPFPFGESPVDMLLPLKALDHSVQVDYAGTPQAFEANLELEFRRNRERYQFLKWGMQAFNTFKVVPRASALSTRSTSSISPRACSPAPSRSPLPKV
jgi:aconitate hydratase